MKETSSYQKELETAEPLSESDCQSLEGTYGFTYRQAIGELIYALVTCRPDISYSVIKLGQYSANPASIHFDAVKQVYCYLHATMDHDGIIYWRKTPNGHLPLGPEPTPADDLNYDTSKSKQLFQDHDDIIHAAVDSDYAGDSSHRKSVTGVVIKLAGGPIIYKTAYQQPTIALSST